MSRSSKKHTAFRRPNRTPLVRFMLGRRAGRCHFPDGTGLFGDGAPTPASLELGPVPSTTRPPPRRPGVVLRLTSDHPIRRPVCRSGIVGNGAWGRWVKMRRARRSGIEKRQTNTANWPNRPSRAISQRSIARSRCGTCSWPRKRCVGRSAGGKTSPDRSS
jgi:hypothetical protein